jgi:hypothetical protein
MRFITKAIGMSATRGLLVGASLAALALAGTPALADETAADSAAAEDGPASPAADGSASLPADKSPIVVTGSRVVTNGMNSPVPVTAV